MELQNNKNYDVLKYLNLKKQAFTYQNVTMLHSVLKYVSIFLINNKMFSNFTVLMYIA